MQQTARGVFEVSLKPQDAANASDGTTLGRMSIDKVIRGDLQATSQGQMLSAVTATQGSAGYVAIERVSGTLDGRQGTFVLQHSGSMTRGVQQLLISVVPDSGTGELLGLAGVFKLNIEGGIHHYQFDYSLPATP